MSDRENLRNFCRVLDGIGELMAERCSERYRTQQEVDEALRKDFQRRWGQGQHVNGFEDMLDLFDGFMQGFENFDERVRERTQEHDEQAEDSACNKTCDCCKEHCEDKNESKEERFLHGHDHQTADLVAQIRELKAENLALKAKLYDLENS